MKIREIINFKLEEISFEKIPVLSGDNGESKKKRSRVESGRCLIKMSYINLSNDS